MVFDFSKLTFSKQNLVFGLEKWDAFNSRFREKWVATCNELETMTTKTSCRVQFTEAMDEVFMEELLANNPEKFRANYQIVENNLSEAVIRLFHYISCQGHVFQDVVENVGHSSIGSTVHSNQSSPSHWICQFFQ